MVKNPTSFRLFVVENPTKFDLFGVVNPCIEETWRPFIRDLKAY